MVERNIEARRTAILAAISGAIAVAAAAFGAHAAASPQAAQWLQTGGQYQLVHAVAVLVLLLCGPGQTGPARMLLGGSALFAATLYAMAMGAPRWLGAVTPIGGLLMILGWLWAAWMLGLRAQKGSREGAGE